MRKTIILALCIAVILITAVGLLTIYPVDSGAEQEGLYVNGKRVEAEIVFVNVEGRDYAELPLIVTLRALGYPVKWLDESRAEINIEGTVYIANLDTAGLYKEEYENHPMMDYVCAVPGSPWGYVSARDGDIFVDQNILRTSLFNCLHVPANIKLDPESERVDVDWDLDKAEEMSVMRRQTALAVIVILIIAAVLLAVYIHERRT